MGQKVKALEQLRELCLYSLQTAILETYEEAKQLFEKYEEAKHLFCDIFVEIIRGFDINDYIEIGLLQSLTPSEGCHDKLVRFLTSPIAESYMSRLIDRAEYLVITPELEVNIVYKALMEHIEWKISEYVKKYKDYNKALNETIEYMKNKRNKIKIATLNGMIEKGLEDLKVIGILSELIYNNYNSSILLSILGGKCLGFMREVINKYYYLAKKRRTH